MARAKFKYYGDPDNEDIYESDPDAFVDGQTPELPPIGWNEVDDFDTIDIDADGPCYDCGDRSDYPYCRDYCETYKVNAAE